MIQTLRGILGKVPTFFLFQSLRTRLNRVLFSLALLLNIASWIYWSLIVKFDPVPVELGSGILLWNLLIASSVYRQMSVLAPILFAGSLFIQILVLLYLRNTFPIGG